MKQRLAQLGIRNILIADDTEDNLNAARRFAEGLPETHFEFYNRGDLVVARIPARYNDIGLILTDLRMEADTAGFEVIQTAWTYHVPAYICSGGFQHRDQPLIRVAPDDYCTPEGMLKDNPACWGNILEHILDLAINKPSSVTGTLFFARKSLTEPDALTGEMARSIVKGAFRQYG